MNNEHYRTILYSIGDGVIVTNEFGQIEEMNPVAEKLTGWNYEDAKGMHINEIFRIVNEETRLMVENPVDRVIREGIIVGLANHTVLISKNRTEFPITDCGAPIKDHSGKLTGTVLVFRDQSVEREQQNKLIESENRYRKLFAATHDGICLHKILYDPNGKPIDYIILDLNKRFEEITGLTYDKIVGKKATEAYNTTEAPYLDIYSEVALSGISRSFETYYGPMDKYFLISAFSHEKGYFATVFLDISEQKRREKELEISNNFFNYAMDMLCIAGFDGYFKHLNPSWSRVLGYSTEELLSKPWIEFVHPDDKEDTKEIRSILVDGKVVYQFENRYICKDGSIKWLSWNSFPQPEEGIMYGVARDITEQKLISIELKKYREQLESMVKERTAQLEEKNRELNRINDLFIGREFRIKELKDNIKILEEEIKLLKG